MKLTPMVYITKYRKKYSVRMEWKKEAYLKVNNFEDLVKLLKKEFEED